MKTIFNIALTGMACALVFQMASAQETPAITGEYNNDQIAKMIAANKAVHAKDVAPSELLSNKLAKDFPNARGVEWELGGDVYEAEFDIGHTDYKAYYDAKGNLLMYVVDVKVAGIPANIKQAALEKYAGYRIEDAEKIVKGTETFYKVDLEKGETDVTVTYKSDGTFIKERMD